MSRIEMVRSIFAYTLLVFWVASAQGTVLWASPDQCDGLLGGQLNRIIDQKDEATNFNVRRKLSDYFLRFPESLKARVEELKPQDTFADMGCGDAHAIENYLEEYPHGGNVIGVTKALKRELPSNPRLKVLAGRYLEEIPEKELGTYRLLTDYFGPYAYSRTPHRILEKYLSHLEVGGTTYIYLRLAGKNPFTQLKLSNGELINFDEWLAKKVAETGDFEVRIEKQEFNYAEQVETEDGFITGWATDDALSLVIKRTRASKKPLHFPDLKLESIGEDTPPTRTYSILP